MSEGISCPSGVSWSSRVRTRRCKTNGMKKKMYVLQFNVLNSITLRRTPCRDYYFYCEVKKSSAEEKHEKLVSIKMYQSMPKANRHSLFKLKILINSNLLKFFL